ETGIDSDARFGECKRRFRRGDDVVACEREFDAPSERETVDARYDGLAAPLDLEQQILPRLPERGDLTDRLRLPILYDDADVSASDQRFAAVGDRGPRDLRMCGRGAKGSRELSHDGFVQCVHRVRTIDGQRGEAVCVFTAHEGESERFSAGRLTRKDAW